jgi:hypothetical protein
MSKIASVTGRREMLEAIRDRLAGFLDGDIGHKRNCECECGVPPDLRTVPTLAKELREIVREIDELPVALEGSELDEITAARRARQAEAASRREVTAGQERPGLRDVSRVRGDQVSGHRGAGA